MGVYYLTGIPYDSNYFAHHGIKGQKWGIRRYQNEDGSLTSQGEYRYGKARNIQKDLNRIDRELAYTIGDGLKIVNKSYKKSLGRKVIGPDSKSDSTQSKYERKAQELDKKIASYKQKQNVLLDIANKNGMSIYTKDVPRPTVRTKEIVEKSLLSIGSLGLYNPTFTTAMMGTRYNVRKNKK